MKTKKIVWSKSGTGRQAFCGSIILGYYWYNGLRSDDKDYCCYAYINAGDERANFDTQEECIA